MFYHLINYNDNLHLSITLFSKHKAKKTIEGNTFKTALPTYYE